MGLTKAPTSGGGCLLLEDDIVNEEKEYSEICNTINKLKAYRFTEFEVTNVLIDPFIIKKFISMKRDAKLTQEDIYTCMEIVLNIVDIAEKIELYNSENPFEQFSDNVYPYYNYTVSSYLTFKKYEFKIKDGETFEEMWSRKEKEDEKASKVALYTKSFFRYDFSNYKREFNSFVNNKIELFNGEAFDKNEYIKRQKESLEEKYKKYEDSVTTNTSLLLSKLITTGVYFLILSILISLGRYFLNRILNGHYRIQTIDFIKDNDQLDVEKIKIVLGSNLLYNDKPESILKEIVSHIRTS